MSTAVAVPAVSRHQAITTAEADALPMYGVEWLNSLTLEVALHADGWHVEYRQRKPLHTRAGPHYVIDATTGDIVFKKYYQ